MPEVRIIIDLPEASLREIEKLAEKNHRSRKAEIEFMLEQFVEKEKA